MIQLQGMPVIPIAIEYCMKCVVEFTINILPLKQFQQNIVETHCSLDDETIRHYHKICSARPVSGRVCPLPSVALRPILPAALLPSIAKRQPASRPSSIKKKTNYSLWSSRAAYGSLFVIGFNPTKGNIENLDRTQFDEFNLISPHLVPSQPNPPPPNPSHPKWIPTIQTSATQPSETKRGNNINSYP